MIWKAHCIGGGGGILWKNKALAATAKGDLFAGP